MATIDLVGVQAELIVFTDYVDQPGTEVHYPVVVRQNEVEIFYWMGEYAKQEFLKRMKEYNGSWANW